MVSGTGKGTRVYMGTSTKCSVAFTVSLSANVVWSEVVADRSVKSRVVGKVSWVTLILSTGAFANDVRLFVNDFLLSFCRIGSVLVVGAVPIFSTGGEPVFSLLWCAARKGRLPYLWEEG